MTIKQKRILFSQLLARLIVDFSITYGKDWEVAIDYVRRNEHGNKAAGGNAKSLHLLGLAADLLLYKNGVYQKDTEAYKPLGKEWESYDSLCSWGGRFNDGNHFSLMHNGMR